MDKRVILAVAGAGKTYYICHSIDVNKRNLILAFTHENLHNIRNELIASHGCVPNGTLFMTFDSFVYRLLVCPFEPSIAEYFSVSDFHSRGITLHDPPEKTKKNGERYFSNPLYKRDNQLGHYVSKDNFYYCATLSEVVMKVKSKSLSLVKRAANRLNLFFDQILIDEFQDFREHDYELIISLSKYVKSILLVGDYFQHSVLGTNNSGMPFKHKKNEVSYRDFVNDLKNQKFMVDETSLLKSRRCSDEVCKFVRSKLGIAIESTCDHGGVVKWIDDACPIMANDSIMKLVFSDAAKYSFKAKNWGYSKGDTFDAVCVILTKQFEKLQDTDFRTQGVAGSTLNKLYVALTRSRGDLYVMKKSVFDKVCSLYVRQKQG